MKKHYILAFAGMAFPVMLLAQDHTVVNLNFPIQHADVSVMDIDGDGYKDILISGENDNGKALKSFKNNGDGTFSDFPAAFPFTPVTRATIDWNDINQDGKPDVIISGSIDNNGTTDKSVEIFTSNGTGTFTAKAVAGLTAVAPGCGFADLNNDGFTDFFVFGNHWQGKSAIYMNDKVGGFTKTELDDSGLSKLIDPDVTVVDFDNDGDLDLFLMAKDETSVTIEKFISVMMENIDGVFTKKDIGITAKGNGSATWADVNADGYLDLLINGAGDWDGSETTGDVVRLYTNNGGNGTFTKVATFQQYSQGSTGDGCRLADWNNDGKLDVIVSGWSTSKVRQATIIYLNNGDLTFTEYAYNDNIPGVGESSIEVADVNNDGKLDLLVTGASFNNYGPGDLGGKASALIINNTANINVAPSVPLNLVASGNSTALTLSWNAATDATTSQLSLSYNIYLKDANGVYFYTPLANEATGNLLVQKMGNVQLNKSWTVKNLPDGTYTWGVQAIDHSFAASTFATGTFVVSEGTLPVSLKSFVAKKQADGVSLKWESASEESNSFYQIFKSANGKDFTLLQTLDAKGAGHYNAYDQQPFAGLNYYRLSQVDNNGKETVLSTKAVEFNLSSSAEVIIYPNPTADKINVNLGAYYGQKLVVSLSNAAGQVVHTQSAPQNVPTFQIDYQPTPGIYFVHLNGGGLSKTLKLIVK